MPRGCPARRSGSGSACPDPGRRVTAGSVKSPPSLLLAWVLASAACAGATGPATEDPPPSPAPRTRPAAPAAPAPPAVPDRPVVRHDAAEDWSISPDSVAAAERFVAQPGRGSDAFPFRLLLANAKLQAGDARQAALELEALRADLAAAPEAVTPGLRRRVLRALAAAWLRVGEQENCILHHGTDSCLLPISPAGQHVEREGSRQAMTVLLQMLHEQPADLEARWLLNVAAMTLGEWPDGLPAEWRVPPSAFASEGEVGRFRDVAAACGLADRQHAGGLCLEDFDGDGRLDLVTSQLDEDAPLCFLHNAGDGRFADRSAESGLASTTGGLNLVHGDVDNDGAPDILVLRSAGQPQLDRDWPLTLLLGDRRGGFRDATSDAGLHERFSTRAAALADYDGDGRLDLFVGNQGSESLRRVSRLYRNTGEGRFEEVGEAAGLALIAPVEGCAWGDADDDGDPELVVTCATGPPLLFRNDGGRFTECARQAGLAGPSRGGSCGWLDFDNDGHLDLFVAGYRLGMTAAVCADYLGAEATDVTPRLYRNRGDGRFEDVTHAAGLMHVLPVLGCNWGDLDNDGWTDLYLGTGEPDLCAIYPNRLFRNDGGRRFLDVTTAAGMGHLQKGAALAFGDLDADGDQDVVEIMGGLLEGDSFHRVLFENPGGGGRWVTLVLEGVAANRSAIGARLRVTVRRPDGSTRDVHHLVGTGGSYGSQSLQAELGLGDATAIESVEIAWPGSGTRQTVRGDAVGLDSCWKIVEGEGPVRLERIQFKLGRQ